MPDTQQKPNTIRDLLRIAADWLTEKGVEGADLDTQILLAHTLDCRRLDLFLDHDRPLTEDERARFRVLMRRRGAREPVAYIVGERGFHALTLSVDPRVLIPRPETEYLVEVGLEALDADAPRFADVGTGSGCIALALLKERPTAHALAVDISADALAVARANALAAGLADRLQLAHADLLAAVGPDSLDLVVSNPPYITPSEEHLLAPEVADHEPRLALFDAEGLPLTASLVRQARQVLRPGGLLAIETGFQTADLVAGFLEREGFEDIRRVQDLARIDRVVCGKRQA